MTCGRSRTGHKPLLRQAASVRVIGSLNLIHLSLDLIKGEPMHQLDGLGRQLRILFSSLCLANVDLYSRSVINCITGK